MRITYLIITSSFTNPVLLLISLQVLDCGIMTGLVELIDWLPFLVFHFFSYCCCDDLDVMFLMGLFEIIEAFFLFDVALSWSKFWICEDVSPKSKGWMSTAFAAFLLNPCLWCNVWGEKQLKKSLLFCIISWLISWYLFDWRQVVLSSLIKFWLEFFHLKVTTPMYINLVSLGWTFLFHISKHYTFSTK